MLALMTAQIMPELVQNVGSGIAINFFSLAWNVAGSLLVVLLVFIVYRFAVYGLGTLQAKGKLSERMAFLIRRVARWAACVFALLLVLHQFGLLENTWASLTAILALVAIGFVAVWSVLSNAFCSLLMMIVRPFDIGDTIEIPADDLKGKVIDFNLIFTTLREENGNLIQIPNNLFFQKPIRRRQGSATISLETQLNKETATEDVPTPNKQDGTS